MLPSPPVRVAGERVEGILAAVACFCALFFGGAFADGPLVWIGAIALVGGALALWRAAPLGRAAAAYVGCLAGLAAWCGISILWSASPDDSWTYTNRSLVYAGFALLGTLVGARVSRGAVAAAATALAAVVVCWALVAKCVPQLYGDYGQLSVARLHEPVGEWNMLALVCVVAIVLALWLGAHSRLGGVALLYVSVVALLLTYSRFGIALGCVAAAAWLVLERDRVESIAALAVGGGAGGGAFAVALALPGITNDAQPKHVAVHDGWIFGLVLLAGLAVVAGVALLLLRVRVTTEHRRAVERAAAALAVVAALAALAVAGVKAHRLWDEFASPTAGQTVQGVNRLGQAGSGNRWAWWREAWTGFTEHPGGGTGAGTFQFTDLRLRQSSDVTTIEPHNVPLQFLSETGIVGFLLYLGAAAVALWAAFRRRDRASLALGLAVAAFFVHAVVNFDWDFVAICGPLLLLGGVVASDVREAVAVRRPLLAAAAVLFALGCVYSLASPWLAQRALANATTTAQFQRARSYDPLATDPLVDLAYAAPTNEQSIAYFRKALSLEPANSSIWYELATFYADAKQWENAYQALSKAYAYDPFGPAGQCGLAAKIRHEVGIRVKSCRGGG